MTSPAFRDALGFEAVWSIADGAAELYKEYISAGLTGDDFAKKFTRLPHLEALLRQRCSRRVHATDHDRCLSSSAQLPAPASRADTAETGSGQSIARSGSSYATAKSSDGIVRAIDPIADIGGRGQRLKPVQEPRRHVQMPKVVVVEKKCLLLAEGRRSLRISTSTSCTAPLAQRTSFASPRPERPCMPRMTPFAERDWESCTNEAETPGAPR